MTGKIFVIVFFGLFCGFCFKNVATQTLKKIFSCQGRPSGYYADIQSGCQIYHMCDGLGRQFSYSCPNTTLFQQRMLICDHWYMVNCSKSEVDYGANLLIGQREKPFVEDDAENPYHRTPRPDLLAHPSAAEYNIIYRTGRAQQQNSRNLVGAESDYEDLNQPAYFLPSHWSTQLTKVNEKPLKKTTKRPIVVNFKSNFKATTPVYPSIAPTEIPLLEDNHPENKIPVVLQPPAQTINFKSKFKATTPVYPTFVTPEEPLAFLEEPDKINTNSAYGLRTILEPPKVASDSIKTTGTATETRPVVNFESKYKATTPVYPKFVTEETPLAVQDYQIDPNNPSLSTVIQPPKSYEVNSYNTVQEPSVYYQPPVEKGRISVTPKNVDWKELRTLLLIPDYDFPLDVSAVRPSYNEGPDSFQVNPISYEIMQRQHA